MIGVITSDCKVPYLDASVYMIILNSFLLVETGFGLIFPVDLVHEIISKPKFFVIKPKFELGFFNPMTLLSHFPNKD